MLISHRETGLASHFLAVELQGKPFSLFTVTAAAHLLKVQLHLFNRFSCSGPRGPRQRRLMLQNAGDGQLGAPAPASAVRSEGGRCSASPMPFPRGHVVHGMRYKAFEGCHAWPKEVIGPRETKGDHLLPGAHLQEKGLPTRPIPTGNPLSCE